MQPLIPSLCRVGALALALLLSLPDSAAQLPVIVTQPTGGAVAVGESITLSAAPQGAQTLQWRRNGMAIAGANGASLSLTNVQVADAGLYTLVLGNAFGTVESRAAIVGIFTTAKVSGGGLEVGPDILHPNGNTFDQVLLTGAAATVTADSGQVTRVSYLDLNGDIVQIEFSGAGALTILLENPSGPVPPAKYNQAGVTYMQGHASLIITGANTSTYISAFSVGRITAVNQALFRDAETYDGIADLGFVVIASNNGRVGGIRLANANLFRASGLTGIYAPRVAVAGSVFVGDITADSEAQPVLVLGDAADVRITGGDLLQLNNRAVEVAGMTELNFTDGVRASGALLAGQPSQGILRRNGEDVTSALLDSQPIALTQARPQYPFSMRLAGISGAATVDFIVDVNGVVQNAFAISSTRVEFEAPSVAAVRQWTFYPARRKGRFVNTHLQVPITYTLTD